MLLDTARELTLMGARRWSAYDLFAASGLPWWTGTGAILNEMEALERAGVFCSTWEHRPPRPMRRVYWLVEP